MSSEVQPNDDDEPMILSGAKSHIQAGLVLDFLALRDRSLSTDPCSWEALELQRAWNAHAARVIDVCILAKQETRADVQEITQPLSIYREDPSGQS